MRKKTDTTTREPAMQIIRFSQTSGGGLRWQCWGHFSPITITLLDFWSWSWTQPGMVSWSWSGSTWLDQQLVMPHFWTKLFDCPRILASWPSFDSSRAKSHFNPLLPRSGRPWESPSQPSIAQPLPPLHCFPPAGVSHLPAIHPSASRWARAGCGRVLHGFPLDSDQ